MKIDSNKVQLVSLTNYEIQIILYQLQNSVPKMEDQAVIYRAVEKLKAAFGNNE